MSADEQELFARLRRLRRESPRAADPERTAPIEGPERTSPQGERASGAEAGDDAHGRGAPERDADRSWSPARADDARGRRRAAAVPTGAEPGGPARARGGIPTWLARRLGRAPAAEASEGSPAALAPAADVGPPGGLAEERNERGAFAARSLAFARAHTHGGWCLDEVHAAAPPWLATLARDPALARVELRGAVYLDIETTGLSGGAGTIPFLVALGAFDGDGRFQLWQGFLRGPEEEPALLAEVARRIAASSCVVSFFGKSFDRHRLEDKMRLHGVAAPFTGRPHLDLYHPLQRLYRAAFEDGRLATMEAELCGVRRRHDLSGRYAPEAWFDFLAGRAHRLEAVFRHNADDVLSLVVLAAHLGRSREERRVGGAPLDGPGACRALGLARLLAEERRDDEALVWVERALVRGAARREALFLRADLLRRAGAHEAAVAAYDELAGGTGRLALGALLALAKLHEHRRRDPAAALAATLRAREMALRVLVGRRDARLVADLHRREERLRARLAAARSEPDPA